MSLPPNSAAEPPAIQSPSEPQSSPPKPHHPLPPPFALSPTPPILLTQGAEALVYRTHYPTPSQPCLLKYRPPKPYRHPTLDARLTRSRLLSEARMLVKCKRAGVDAPGVLGADWDAGWVAVEWVEGGSVRAALEQWEARRKRQEPIQGRGAQNKDSGTEDKVAGRRDGDDEEAKSLTPLLHAVGRAIAALHAAGIVHGDLTTSNLMLRHVSSASLEEQLAAPVVLIDFGLASSTLQHEDRAVDLYVLERAFAATHPGAEPHFHRVLEAYGGTGKKDAKGKVVGESYIGAYETIKRLEGVRLRGRKRSMLG